MKLLFTVQVRNGGQWSSKLPSDGRVWLIFADSDKISKYSGANLYTARKV